MIDLEDRVAVYKTDIAYAEHQGTDRSVGEYAAVCEDDKLYVKMEFAEGLRDYATRVDEDMRDLEA